MAPAKYIIDSRKKTNAWTNATKIPIAIIGRGAKNAPASMNKMASTNSCPVMLPKSRKDRDSTLARWPIISMGRIIGMNYKWGVSNTEIDRKERKEVARAQNPIAEYLDHFRTDKMIEKGKPLAPHKEVRLLEELYEIASGKSELDGKKIKCTGGEFFYAIRETCNRVFEHKPLLNHNYLKMVILTHMKRKNLKDAKDKPRVLKSESRYGKEIYR